MRISRFKRLRLGRQSRASEPVPVRPRRRVVTVIGPKEDLPWSQRPDPLRGPLTVRCVLWRAPKARARVRRGHVAPVRLSACRASGSFRPSDCHPSSVATRASAHPPRRVGALHTPSLPIVILKVCFAPEGPPCPEGTTRGFSVTFSDLARHFRHTKLRHCNLCPGFFFVTILQT